ncbi:MAG TPA: YaiO family outer membrane beta-barrel protein [Flavobacteriaceae bacterium]|nr:YaiO family outer membrane beta-barrel protein [Flavobacteriaceae bacterium]
MKYFFFLVFALSLQVSFAQEIDEANTDHLLKLAQSAYRQDQFSKAIEYTQKGLAIAPNYHDIRIVETRSYLALKEPEKANKNLEYLTKNASEYSGVKELAYHYIDFVSDFDQKEEVIEKYLEVYPGNLHLQSLKAYCLLENNQKKEAQKLSRALLERKDLSGRDRYLLQRVYKRSTTREIGANYQLLSFSDDYKRTHPWHTASLEYLQTVRQTSLIGRFTYTDRGYAHGEFYELEAYPVFGENFYAMLNLGASNGTLFPDFRGSASIYYNFAEKFEGELGTRVSSTNENTYFSAVAGLTMYQGSFYLNVRAFLGPQRAEQFVQNYQLNVRYYTKNADNYWFARLGSGISPDEKAIYSQVRENPDLKTYYANFGVNKSFGIHHIVKLGVGLLTQKLDNVRAQQYVGSIGYRYRF